MKLSKVNYFTIFNKNFELIKYIIGTKITCSLKIFLFMKYFCVSKFKNKNIIIIWTRNKCYGQHKPPYDRAVVIRFIAYFLFIKFDCTQFTISEVSVIELFKLERNHFLGYITSKLY